MNDLESETLERLEAAGMDFSVYLQTPGALAEEEEEEEEEDG